MGRVGSGELQGHGVEVVNNVAVERIVEEGTQLHVRGSGDFQATGDVVLVAVGVRPLTDVAKSANVAEGSHGALRVTRRMETNVPDIYAARDCIETYHLLLERPPYLPLLTTAT